MHRFTATSLLAAGTALALATPAVAQDNADYSGFYIGGSIGGALQNNDKNDIVVFDVDGDGDFNDTVTTAAPGNPDAFSPGFCNGAAFVSNGVQSPRGPNNAGPGCSNDDDELEYALKVGYDQQFGSNFVLGAVIEAAMSDVQDSTTAFSSTPASYAFTREMDWALSGRLRGGYTPNGKGLFYVTGGLSYADVKHDFNTTNTVNSFTLVDAGDNLWGWQAGGGAEIALGSGIGVGLEYLYNRYDDEDHFVTVGALTNPPTSANNPFIRQFGSTDFKPNDEDFDFHSLRVNLMYKFHNRLF